MTEETTEFGKVFRNETPVLIVDSLLSSDKLDVDGLATQTGKHPSTLYQYLPKLESLGIIDSQKIHSRKHYSISSEVEQLFQSLNDTFSEHREENLSDLEEATADFFS